MDAVITNVFSDDNKGGAVLTQAAAELIRQLAPDASISMVLVEADDDCNSLRHTLAADPSLAVLAPPLRVVLDRIGGWAAILVSLVCLLLGRRAGLFSSTLRHVSTSDLAVSKGGHVFVERRGKALMRLWVTVFPLLYAARCGVPTIVFGATVGPFSSTGSRILNGFLLRRFTIVAPRDKASERWALELGVHRERVVPFPDGVFGWNGEVKGRPEGVPVTRYQLPTDRYAVVATGYPAGDEADFVSELRSALGELVADRVIDEIVVVLQVVGPDGMSEDRQLSETLVQALDPLPVTFIIDDLSPVELFALYRDAALVCGRRLHATLFGLLSGSLAIPLLNPSEPWKAKHVFQDLGLEEFVADTADPGSLRRTIGAAIRDREAYRVVADAAVEANRLAWAAGTDQVRATLQQMRVL